MLILGRKPGQSIIIDGRIKVTLLESHGAHGRQLKLGVEAPPEVSIDREEVHQQRQSNPHGK